MLSLSASVSALLTHGVYVIAVQAGLDARAFTAAWVMQVSFEPLLLAFSINPLHRSFGLLTTAQQCSITVLSQEQLTYAEHFGQDGLDDKMTGFTWLHRANGIPVLSEGLGYFACRVLHITPAGDHQLVVCEVIEAARLHTGVPLLYADTGNMDGMAQD